MSTLETISNDGIATPFLMIPSLWLDDLNPCGDLEVETVAAHPPVYLDLAEFKERAVAELIMEDRGDDRERHLRRAAGFKLLHRFGRHGKLQSGDGGTWRLWRQIQQIIPLFVPDFPGKAHDEVPR